MSAVFITATGTEIGKTHVATGLIRHWRAAGQPAEALKPVVTGFNPATAKASDPGLLLSALGQPVTPAGIDRIAPFRFAAALAPDMAARREHRAIDYHALLAFCRGAIAARQDTLLIEGIGGIMVPLDDRHTVLDWMLALRLPLLLVTGSYLGSISHTLSCLDVLARRELGIKALVVNETPGSTVSMSDTLDTLAKFARSVPIVGLRRMPTADVDQAAFQRIADLL